MPTLFQKLTKPRALAEAKFAAESYYTLEVASVREADEQGMFSRTFVVSLTDGSDHIVELKDNEMDLTRVVFARALLGDVVPSMHAVKTNRAYFAYVTSLIPGAIWSLNSPSGAHNIRLAAQIGRLIARCSLGISSSGVVEHYAVPRLSKILEKESIDADGRARIENLLTRTDELKSLPLALCHIDINEKNVILNDSGDIVGLIDWEHAGLFPFGMNAWCIRFLSVKTDKGVDRVNEHSLSMAKAF